MPNIRIILLSLALFSLHLPANASEEPVEIDKSKVFPVQRNTAVIHSANKDAADTNADQVSSSADKQKSSPKDTSLQINGNGGSTNRPAGGTATLRKRFTFD
ncbi:hypothetical protein [Polynucleobacter sp. MWH-UH25E]|uniref:hypothetical protein n=1 Tax=Polynucleobacter sp. MWH-UH25E TaxID=1855616 RepID=UPI001BFD6E39|nr:hypothetical protein [Polynucleobacter sp. MWH-UH25E]QWD62988.1 hypothetical protein ICV39_05120 [Polynucleobacter sp. MWH-UH25E]